MSPAGKERLHLTGIFERRCSLSSLSLAAALRDLSRKIFGEEKSAQSDVFSVCIVAHTARTREETEMIIDILS